MIKAHTQLMFQGDAEAALDLYSKVFPNLDQKSLTRYGPDDGLPEGTLKQAEIDLAGHAVTIYNSPPVHDFTFTPSMSLFVEFNHASLMETAFEGLAETGSVLMPLDDYGFSRSFGWLQDSFGVSWQFNLTSPD